MKREEFKIGEDFLMSGNLWRCTDIGTRVIVGIKLDKNDSSWYNGPPYAVAETVIDEYDFPACSRTALNEPSDERGWARFSKIPW